VTHRQTAITTSRVWPSQSARDWTALPGPIRLSPERAETRPAPRYPSRRTYLAIKPVTDNEESQHMKPLLGAVPAIGPLTGS
jgi:hypothetical protein